MELKTDELTTAGDHDGADTWRRISAAVVQLANNSSPGPLHSSERTRNVRPGFILDNRFYRE